jgi:glucose-1-phosphate thymidylyltransferase
MKGLLLAGGHGTRLRPLTFTGNKHMIPIANQPMVFYGLRHLAEGGISDVGIILGPLHEGLEQAIGDGSAFGLKVTYIHQGDPKGLAHAVLCAREFLGDDPFVMYLGDNLLQEGVRPLIEQYRRGGADAVVAVTPVAHPNSYGVVEMDGERIVSIAEKPAVPKSNLALVGVYLFTSKIHPIIERLQPSRRNELEITDAIWNLHQAGGVVAVRQVQGWWKDTGRPEDLLEANDLVLATTTTNEFVNLGTIEDGATLTGPVRIGRGSSVHSSARIEGPVVIGENVRVEEGARVGPGVSVGSGSTLGRLCSVRHSILMEGTVLEGPIGLTNSIVGRDAKIRSDQKHRIEFACVLGDSTQLRF